MPKKQPNKWTVAIKSSTSGKLHKITKIISLNGGGFSILTPYHKARSGVLFKQTVNPNIALKAGERKVGWTECALFTAENRAKLTYHMDGFVQFSSENPKTIISGRDPNTGEPKGLGIMARSLSNPSESGPSLGITVWGLEAFDAVRPEECALVFEPTDFYYRKWGPEEVDSLHLGIYVFPVDAVPPTRFVEDQPVMDFVLRFPMTAGVAGSVVTLKTVRLEAERVYLGLYVECWAGEHPSKSGWIMSGPGNWNANQIGYVLGAVYPRDHIPIEGRPSLDYKPTTDSWDAAEKPVVQTPPRSLPKKARKTRSAKATR